LPEANPTGQRLAWCRKEISDDVKKFPGSVLRSSSFFWRGRLVAIDGSHDADASEHSRAAALDHQKQSLHRSTPFRTRAQIGIGRIAQKLSTSPPA
jgi:hypothetical protein